MQPRVLVLIVGILLAAGVIVWRIQSVPALSNPALTTGIGQAFAAEVIRATQGAGRIVIVTGQFPDDRLAGFHNALKSSRNVATETVPAEGSGNTCPPATLLSLLQRHADAAAIVFFVELPEWSLVQPFFPQSGVPQLIAGASRVNQIHYAGYFQNNHLAALITPRMEATTPAGSPKTPSEWFTRDYQIINPQNYPTLLTGPNHEMF